MRPPQGNNGNTAEEFPVPEELPIVGGPDSLPPWLRPQAQGSDSVGIEPWLRPATTGAPSETASPADRFIDNTDDTEEDSEKEAPKEERHSYGSYSQPGYYSGYSSNIGTLGGYSGYPYTAGPGYAGNGYGTGYNGNGYVYPGNGYSGYSGYNGYGYFPTNTGYTYY